MANGLIAQTRRAAQNQMAPNDFFSLGNLKKFGGDFVGGAVPGAIGGGLFQLGSAGYNALSAPTPPVQTIPGGAQLINPSVLQQKGGLSNALQGSPVFQRTGNPLSPYMGTDITSKIPGFAKGATPPAGFWQQAQNALSGVQEVTELASKFMPQAQTAAMAGGLSQAIQQGPRASSGPISQASNAGQSPYYSFEKYLKSNSDMRPLIPDHEGRETSPGVHGNPPNQPDVQGGAAEQTIGEQEDIFRPKSGLSQKLYDFTKYVETSPVIQGGAGLVGAGAATYFSGGALLPYAAAIGGATGGAVKGIAGQLRQFLANKDAMQQQEAQQSYIGPQPRGVSPALM